MQIKYLHKNVYRLYAWARTQECLDVYRAKHADVVRKWQSLKAEGVSDKKCAEFVGISRASYYRYRDVLNRLARGIMPPSKRPQILNKPKWGEAEKQLVLRIRRENQTWGKDKIAIVLRRDHGQTMSASTVGRILKTLFTKGIITKSRSAPRARRTRNFRNSHAKRWVYKAYENIKMGERVQIDHMTVTKNGITVKHFQAWERKSKFIHAQVYSHAKASSAKRFLKELIDKAPFKIKSIQVDGGSEFMAEFEQVCEDLNIPLSVLPPSRPKYNGGVERGNRTFKEEFYYCRKILADSIGAMRFELQKAVQKYNTYRPHHALAGLTPMAYIKNTQKGG
ncbi:MAG: integrase core domain-containing protein [Devosiaceae bacterium]|nr:integrase core domain-containing protein [Devosiaceae bacterium]